MTKQIYEPYWSYTAAYTDVLDGKGEFVKVLQIIVDFIDQNAEKLRGKWKPKMYKDLQSKIQCDTGIDDVSVRKAINQCVKLGFIEPHLKGYNLDAKAFLQAKTISKRRSLLSKIVYSNSKFNSSITKDSDSTRQINFIIRTIIENGSITKLDLMAMMFSFDISKFKEGYLTARQLAQGARQAEEEGFDQRKYNQISHLWNLLGKLDNLREVDNSIYLKEDADRMFGEEVLDDKTKKRDPYLQRVYKNQLEEESITAFKSETPRCMLEHLDYPVLIASHIKPFASCNDIDAFNVDNGLLLSKNMDSLFDLGWMTFGEDGIIVPSKDLGVDVQSKLKEYRLDPIFINEHRMNYMQYHRMHVFEKRYKH